jgi:uncharacterized protein YecE (DUF72 family)
METKGIDIRVGTSGFDYPDWAGILYPPDLPRRQFLEVYSQTFSTLELNFSYYGMPTYSKSMDMVNRANPKMDFSIKAHQSLTHKIDPSSLTSSAQEYLAGIQPLMDFNRLSAILFEFPYSFHYEPDHRIYLDKLLNEFKGLPVVVEFRHKDWFNERVFEGLAKRQVGLCLMDMPANAMPEGIKTALTSDICYIRLHGRNEANWWEGNNVSRYDYHYSKGELSDWVLRINDAKEKTKKIRVYFNNHARGNAVQNAKDMKDLLADAI